MGQDKQAKVITPDEEQAVLDHLITTRHAIRNRVTFLLSIKAGLRVIEISGITWAMVTDASGEIADSIQITNKICQRPTTKRA